VPLDAFGANGSVRRVADRLAAAAGLLALKMQLLQKRRLGLICPFWIRIWRSVAATRPSPPRRHHQDATTGLQPSIICGIIDPLSLPTMALWVKSATASTLRLLLRVGNA
jgi:hypothetical protein